MQDQGNIQGGPKTGIPWGLSSHSKMIPTGDYMEYFGKKVPTYILEQAYRVRLKLPKYVLAIANKRAFQRTVDGWVMDLRAALESKPLRGYPIKVLDLRVMRDGEISVQYTTNEAYSVEVFRTFRKKLREAIDDFLLNFQDLIRKMIALKEGRFEDYILSKTGKIHYSKRGDSTLPHGRSLAA